MIFLVVATNEKGIMAKNGTIPWKCSSDMKFFKFLTMSKSCIMGRKTYESLSPLKFLSGRDTIVISSKDVDHPSVLTVKSLENGIFRAKEIRNDRDIAIIGGLQVYQEALKSNIVDVIYLNIIKDKPVEEDDTCLKFDFDLKKYNLKYALPYPEFTTLIYERNTDGKIFIPEI